MFLTFSESRDIIRSFNFKSQNEFTKWIKGKSKEHKIPTNPNKYYKNEWISWNDWLNNDNVPFQNRVYYEYTKCKEILSIFKFKNRNEFYRYMKVDNKDKMIPNRPDHVYKKNWECWQKFLSIDKVPPITKSKLFFNFEDAKKYVFDLRLTQESEYINYIDNNNINFLPKRPDYVYREKWKGYIDFLGCEINRSSFGERKIKEYLEINSIRFIREKKFETCKRIKELPFDFYLPDYNICIEYDGELHYKSILIFGGEQTLNRIKNNDKIKTKWCKENNILLIRIPYKKKNKIFKILDAYF